MTWVNLVFSNLFIDFISSICLRQKLVQDEKNYSFEVGNIGCLELMTEVHQHRLSESFSGDEASGGGSPVDQKGI